MKVLGIFGSPRRQGNSDTLMKAFLQGAAEAGAAGGRNIPARDENFPLPGNISLFQGWHLPY